MDIDADVLNADTASAKIKETQVQYNGDTANSSRE